MRRLLLIFALAAATGAAQTTTVTIPTTVAQSGVGGFGINLGGINNYGNQQTVSNFLQALNGSFAPQQWNEVSLCGGGTTTTWIDSTSGTLPAGFFEGASYWIVQGADKGATGTVTNSTAGTGSAGPTLTLSGTLTAACDSGDNQQDEMILTMPSPSSSWAGAYTPDTFTAAQIGYRVSYTGSASSFYEQTDLPGDGTVQALETNASASSSSVDVSFLPDAAYQTSFSWLTLNGTYTLSFDAKGLSGSPSIVATVVRQSGSTYVDQTVKPTVNTTPGAGWSHYSYSFTASENGTQQPNLSVDFVVSGGTAILNDAALTETETNPTVLRDAVYNKLVAYHPSVLRYMDYTIWGCSVDNMIAATPARQLCGFAPGTTVGQPGPAIGLNDFLEIANAIGAAPWFTFAISTDTTEAQHLIACLAGQYTGCSTDWISTFAAKGQHIYLEFGNEQWNSDTGGASLWTNNSSGDQAQAYSYVFSTIAPVMRASAYWSSTIKLVASGWGAPGQTNQYGWNGQFLQAVNAVTNGKPDIIDAATYQFTNATVISSNQNIFGPMYTEPVNNNSLSSGDYNECEQEAGTYSVACAVYETNLNTLYWLSSATQSQIQGISASVGAGLGLAENLILGLRDAKMWPESVFTLSGVYNGGNACTDSGSWSCTGASFPAPLWSVNLFESSTADTIDRPTGIALQVMNAAIGAKTNLLATTQTGTPTYSQAAAQPDPNNGGADGIAANSAVPLVETAAFSDGGGNYALIALNLSLTASEPISFAGTAAPSGTVTKTVFGSSNAITDNNENVTPGGACVVCVPTSTTISNPTSDTLAPYSITTYTWSAGGSPAAPSGLSVIVIQ